MWASTARSVCGAFSPQICSIKRPTAHHPARFRHQQCEQLELRGRQVEPLAAHFGPARRGIDLDGCRLPRRGASRIAGLEAAQHRRDARRQLRRVVRLGQEVVGAGLEGEHPIDLARLRAHQDHRRALEHRRLPDQPAQAQAREIREIAVEQDHVGALPLGLGERRTRVVDLAALESRRGEDRRNPLPRVGVAIDEQHPLRSLAYRSHSPLRPPG